jgi:Tol biopolymer transport system component
MSDISVYDLNGTTEIRRLTFDGTNRFLVWSADNQRIAFQSLARLFLKSRQLTPEIKEGQIWPYVDM